MRINREQTLYLVFKTSEIFSLQHRLSHMRQNSQPTWQLVLSTAAKDTYLLSPVMLPPLTGHLLFFKSQQAFRYVTVILLMDYTYGCFMSLLHTGRSSTQASKQAFVTLYKLISFYCA